MFFVISLFLGIGFVLYFLRNIAEKIEHLEKKIDHLTVQNEKNIHEATQRESELHKFPPEKQRISHESLLKNTPAQSVAASISKKQGSSFALENTTQSPIQFVEKEQKIVGESTIENSSANTLHKAQKEQELEKSSEPTIIDQFIAWMQNDWPLKIGGLLIILAVGWFVSLAASQGWLSETARVIIGYLFGAGALFYGVVRSQKVRVQGNVFLTIGIAAIFVATLAAVKFISVQMPEPLALLVMLLTVGLVTLISQRQKNITLTTSVIGFGAAIPLFFFSGVATQIIFLYLFVLTLGVLWIVVRTNWRDLTVLMLLVVAFYSIGYFIAEGAEQSWQNMILAFAFTTVFYLANVIAITKTKNIVKSDIVCAVGITVLYLIWTYLFGPENFRIMLLLIGALLFSTASYVIHTTVKVKTPMVIYGSAAFILIAVATSEIFGGASLVIAYLTEVTVMIALLIYALRDRFDQNMQVLCTILFVIPLILLLGNIQYLHSFTLQAITAFERKLPMPEMIESVLPHLLAIFIACTCAFVIALMTYIYVPKQGRNFARTFLIAGLVICAGFIWLALHVFMGPERAAVATFSALFIYMIAGVSFYVTGAKENSKPYQILGSAFFIVVLLRIFTVEFWQMEMHMRIITFFVIGALFILAAYIARARSKHVQE